MNAVPGQDGHLLHVIDSNSGQKWLVDGGALMSIVPPSTEQRRSGPCGTPLQAANGTRIECFGLVTKTLVIGKRPFTFEFTVADVRQPLIGADFLAHFHLAPDHRHGALLDLEEFPATIPATLAHGVHSNPFRPVNQVDSPYYTLLDEFPSITTPSFTLKEAAHGVTHHIPTEGRPVISRSRRLNPEKLAVAKAELDKLVKLGICHRGKSNWSSPLMVATKPCVSPCSCHLSSPCGGWRVCGDYRRLNNMTVDDKYPVRTLQDFTSDLHGKKIFSKIDLLKGYHQIPVEEEDIRKTAVITPFGLFIFPRTPFGLKNAGQDFQRLMDVILGDLPRVFVYIDDILVASETPAQHLEDLKAVFSILAENGLVVNRAKCTLGASSLQFLGYLLDENGISPLPERVEGLSKFPVPTTVKELQRFLGIVNYYRRFIPRAAQHLTHLTDSLKGKPKTLVWSADCQASFEATKSALAAATLLHHPRPLAQISLTTDASKIAIGGVLEQRGPRGWEPLGFWSAKLQGNQREWPPYDRELLAAFRACRHFRPMLEGRVFTLYTDHQSLVPSLAKKTKPHTARQAYQLSCIAEYTTDIRYVEGKSNVVADALSRPTDELDVSGVVSPVSAVRHTQNAFSTTQSSFDLYQNPLASISSKFVGSRGPSDEATGFVDPSSETPPRDGVSAKISAKSAEPFGRDSRLCASHNNNCGKSKVTLGIDLSDSSVFRSSTANNDSIRPSSTAAVMSPSLSSSPASDFSSSGSSTASAAAVTPDANLTIVSCDPHSTSLIASPRPLDDLNNVINAVGHQGIDLEEMAQEQPLDPDYQRLSTEAGTGLNFKKVRIGARELIVDISNGPARPFVPFSWRRRVFDAIHGLGHPGVERSRQSVSSKFVWPTMRQDVSLWARECVPCQRSKVRRNVVPPIGEFIVPQRRFEHLNLDIVTMPLSNGYRYLLTAVDRMSRWPVAIPMCDITAESVADAFAHGWVSLFGVPSSITTDRGSQFSSTLWQQLMSVWGIKTHLTTAYHPAANGLVERFHRRLKEALLALGTDSVDEWFWRLPCVLLAIRTTLKPDLGASPADMVFGEGLAVPGTLLSELPPSEADAQQHRQSTLANLRLEVARLQPTPTSAHRVPRQHLPEDLQTASHVFVRRPPFGQASLATPYLGPYRVISRESHSFRISLPGGGTEVVSVARLKPAFVSLDVDRPDTPPTPVTPPAPPPQGRRPGWRTRPPSSTSRQTRSQAIPSSSHPSVDERLDVSVPADAGHPRPGSSTDSQPLQEPHSITDGPPSSPHSTSPFDLSIREGESFAPPVHTPPPLSPPPSRDLDRPVRPRTFSKPTSKNFSFRRRRPDVSFLAGILREQLAG